MSIDYAKLEASLTSEPHAKAAVNILLRTINVEIRAIGSASSDHETRTSLMRLAMDVDENTADLSAATVGNPKAA